MLLLRRDLALTNVIELQTDIFFHLPYLPIEVYYSPQVRYLS